MTGKKFLRAAGARAAIAIALSAGAGLSPGLAADWDFTPRVSAGQYWTDNVTAAPSGLEQSEWVTTLEPGFSLGLDSIRGEATLDYEAQAAWYRDNSDFDDVYHRLDGNGQLILQQDHLFVDGFARYDQVNVDPTRRVSTGNLLQTNNRSDAAVYGFSPWYTNRIGNWAEGLARFRYQGVRYRNTDDTTVRVQDSDTNSVEGRLGSQRGKPGLSWDASVSYQRTDFEFVPEFEYGKAELELGYPVGLRTRLTVSGGLESDVLTDRSAGGFDESFWFVGVEWNPTQLQSLRARVGDRFFGTAYELDWRRRGTRGDLFVTYTEEPTTANQNLFDPDNVFNDYRPGSPTLDPEVYLRKRLSVGMNYDLARTRMTASVYAEKRERDELSSGLDDEVAGLRFNAVWDAAARTRVTGTVRAERRDFGVTLEKSNYYDVGLGLRRDLTRTLFAELLINHVRRDFDFGDSYRINSAGLVFGAEF